MDDFTLQITRILILATAAFAVTLMLTPVLTHFLYKYKLGKQIRDDGTTPIFSSLHGKKKGTPTMGGILIWATLILLTIFFALVDAIFDSELFDFLSRSETLLPLGAVVVSAFVGLADDLLGIFGRGRWKGGLRVRHRLLLYTAIAAIGAWWFFYKLDWTTLHVPFFGNYDIGIWYIPIFLFIIIATSFSVNETDGLDGLAGGVLLVAFASYAGISFFLGRYDLAAFCSIIIGSLVAFLWFNVYPARFFMGDTGSMPLGVTLGTIAMLTNYALLLPLIGFILVLESSTVLLQIISKKLLNKKLFLSSPIHHHFEALGWPETKVTMRFWIISAVMASVGLIIFLLDRQLY